MQVALTVGIFGVVLALVLIRPRGLNEAWFTVAGGAAMLLCGLETPAQAVRMVWDGKDALLFLVGLLILAELMNVSGFFEWSAIYAARSAREDGRALFRNVFLLGAAVTALLSLDTTAVMLTPIVLAFVGRLKLDERPFLLTCAFVANTGSLILQVSNLTNLLFAGAFHWGFAGYAARMGLPQLLVLLANYWLFRVLLGKSLAPRFSNSELPAPDEVIPDRAYFRTAIVVFLFVVAGYFLGALIKTPPYVFALLGSAVLGAIGVARKQVNLGVLGKVSWAVFPFVIGLFTVVRAMENLGLEGLIGRGLAFGHGSPVWTALIATFGAGVGTNVVNNIPMALLSISSLGQASDVTRYATLIGCNIGPNLTVAGSLATLLVITSARKRGKDISALEFFKLGLVCTPVLLAASLAGLLVSFAMVP